MAKDRRVLAYKDGARIRLISRQGVDHTERLPELAAAIAKLQLRFAPESSYFPV